MVFIGERKGREVEMSTPGPDWESGRGGRRCNALSSLGLGKTVSCCSLFLKKKKKKIWLCAWEILGQVQHLFCSKALQS